MVAESESPRAPVEGTSEVALEIELCRLIKSANRQSASKTDPVKEMMSLSRVTRLPLMLDMADSMLAGLRLVGAAEAKPQRFKRETIDSFIVIVKGFLSFPYLDTCC